MAEKLHNIKSVAIIGAGASGAVTAAALRAENYFEKIRVFERRESAGGTWIYDPSPRNFPLHVGALPPTTDPSLPIPDDLPRTMSPNLQERFSQTPIYDSLTTNVPDIAMSFSDLPFPYGPFVPHHIPRQYIENYFSAHKTDTYLQLNTTVEDVLKLPGTRSSKQERWKLTLRKHDSIRQVDIWWEEEFDAVVLANGHYSIPFIPQVEGLEEYMKIFPGRVSHSKTYRTPDIYTDKKVLVIGNSASGYDCAADLLSKASLPVYQSIRSKSRWDGDTPPEGLAWFPVIKRYLPNGRIVFVDDSYLDDIDEIIYCTGYLPSYPFWSEKKNGQPLWDYSKNRLVKTYQHTFFQDFKTLAIVGLPRVLTFRSFEYQAIALARLWSGRNRDSLPDVKEMQRWESQREKRVTKEKKKFHDIEWDNGETLQWLGQFYGIAGLNKLTGEGRIPPVLNEETRWAIEHRRKYPEPGKDESDGEGIYGDDNNDNEWIIVDKGKKKDLLAFI